MKPLMLALLLSTLAINVKAGIFYKKETLNIAGQQKLNVYLPWKLNPKKRYPLFINLHGYSGKAFLQNLVLPLTHLVARKKFILISPEGLKDTKGNRYWNSLDCCTGSAKEDQKRDDVEYLKSLIGQLSEKYPISKTYIAGHSNGGFMAYQMACEAPDLVAGIVNYGGAAVKADCHPTQSVKILHIHGADDATIKYAGCDWHLSAEDSVEQWKGHNRCKEKPKKQEVQEKSWRKDRISSKVWGDCVDDSKVALWTIDAGQHRDLLSKSLAKNIVDYFLD